MVNFSQTFLPAETKKGAAPVTPATQSDPRAVPPARGQPATPGPTTVPRGPEAAPPPPPPGGGGKKKKK